MPEGLRHRDQWLFAVACLALRAPALLSSRVYDPDEAAIALGAQTMARGGTLYRDMADRKPPLPAQLYEWWFRLTSSHDLRGPRLMVTILLAAAAIVLVRDVARARGRAVAIWAGILYVLGAMALVPADAGAANYAHFALPFATIAIVWARRRATWWSLAAGVMFGLALLSRQSWIFAAPAAITSVWIARRLKGVVALAIGTCAAVATAALIAPWHDYWFWNFRSSSGFLTASIGVGTAVGRGLGALALFTVFHLALVAGAALSARSTLRSDADLWVWVFTGVAASAAGFRFYGHYWLQVLPPLVLLAAPALAVAGRRFRLAARGTLALGAAIAVVLLANPTWVRTRHPSESLAAAVRSCTTSSDRVFLWGSFPELLMQIGRPVAGGLVHSDFVTGRSGGRTSGTDAVTPGAETRMLADLRNEPPTLLIDTSGVPDLGYGAFPMQAHAGLADVTHGYTAQPTTSGFVWWWRDGHPACPALSAADSR